MKIVAVTEKNASDIQKSREFFHDCWTAEMVSDGLKSGRLFGYLAEIEEETVGFILFSRGVFDGDIESLFVSPAARRKGIAKELLKAATDNLFGGGAEKIFLEVRAGNLPAISLYGAFGFSEINRRKKYYPDGEEAVVMVKEKPNGI